jgi:acyl carrier protein
MSVEQQVRSYILENFLFTNDAAALVNGDSFLEKGIIDSTGVLEMIYFLEEQFEIKVADQEMIPENLDSVDNIVRYVSNKQSGA